MSRRTVIIVNHSNSFFEADAAAAIMPGHLVELDSSGDVKVHAEATGFGAKTFAIENALLGKGIDEAYAAEEPVRVWTPQPGDEVNALLSNGETVAVGDFVESNGDGTVQKFTSGTIIGQAVEAVDMSGSSTVDPDGRIIIRIV